MTKPEYSQEWILLIHQLPPRPTNLRVRIWRKLQKLGAVALKNSVYALPFSDSTFEDFQWLKQEIETGGGEATVLRAGAVERPTDKDIIDLFRKTRDEEYASVTAEMDGLTSAIREQKRGGHLSVGRAGHYEAELEKLHKELERIITTDFFKADGRAASEAAYKHCHAALQIEQGRKNPKARGVSKKDGIRNVKHYQGRRWVTRRNLFIDRLAAIWLIKRFVDPKARFYFVGEQETIADAIGFDMFDGEFTHRGPDCTFETMVKEFDLTDDIGLQTLAEIVHDLDLKDGRFNRSEAPGFGAVIQGLADRLNDDRKLMRQCEPIFDGLYELIIRSHDSEKQKATHRKRVSRGSGGRSNRK